ncbi:enamine deaminase RidA (YjgF/YER057c/UK114 family) [Lacibacter cauensis]|uniref:Enamine deaminase RidA (YjgF/YER057c/UK114 family) n=1 Tax=Lacibacter cauensis TaxID=510947 RepID=A0A562SNX6_9BACT|nr:RidA family protein [Lacibacter cauensis]TWI83011.1 enamine deaminase RidA (YjgF/YER057c/UK114 family) [Lacibacter cauensis]
MKQLLAFLLLLSSFTAAAQNEEQKIKELGLQLPPVSKPIANYVKYVRTGNLLFLAGHGPSKADGTNITGKVGKDLTIEQGYEAAKITALSLIATLKDALGGDLSKVKRIVKVNGYVNCLPDFTDQPKVINGCSDLLVAIFGERGKHARAAMGMVALPSNIAVEIELVVEVE